MRKPDSLRGQLVLLAILPMLLVIAASATATYVIAYRIASEAYDYSLLDTARTIATRIHPQAGGPARVALSPDVREVLSYDPLDTVYYGVVSKQYGVLAGRSGLPVPQHAPSDGLYYDGTVEGQNVRLIVLPIGDGIDVIVAETLRKREAITRQLMLGVLLTESILGVVGGVLLWIAVGRGMAPVQRIVHALAARGHHDLRPVPTGPAPSELRSLGESVNDLMARLDHSLSLQHRFVADAAHQLRTPIAGLLAQIETALAGELPEPTRDSLEQLRVSSRRAARLVNQLLSLARAEPGQQNRFDFGLVDLTALVRKTCAEWVPEALRNGADLGYDGLAVPVTIAGHAPLLEDMVGNLIENAIRYGRAGTAIDVRLTYDGGPLVLEVSNDGEPIAAPERERMFERFYRIPGSSGTGTGLGLAIVRDVARMHGASVDVQSHDGRNRFRVSFPAGLQRARPESARGA